MYGVRLYKSWPVEWFGLTIFYCLPMIAKEGNAQILKTHFQHHICKNAITFPKHTRSDIQVYSNTFRILQILLFLFYGHNNIFKQIFHHLSFHSFNNFP